ncbi:LemA family protein [Dyadobacter psychrophilus]|jgi:LemA protein|uniref:LemA protein n=1 Tax=Dyadobacter psychrophilus TaxID=651661 RepID=A0A1T5GXY8_9BACT|nr:LemA family protein [Dyadobacter psychrophilus]SKC13277.1 LemA protein [Dyadobacter psychrophilus]
MSKGLIAVIVVILILGFVGCGKYNGLVSKDEVVKESWAKVESQYQRRADLIPNLVSTVKGAADFEKGTLTAVIEARAKATQTTINAGDLTPENIAKFQGAQDQLSGALSRLLVTVEQYPQLKANQNFLDLQAQLEGTENRITVARNDFNTVVKDYNQEVRTFPNNLFAGVFGFSQKGYFTAAAGSDKAPTVQF